MNSVLGTESLDQEGARDVLRDLVGVDALELLGQGGEGFVFGQGDRAFKVFRRGTSALTPDQLDLLRSALGDARNPPKRILPVKAIVARDGNLVIVTPRVHGQPYCGGHWWDLVELLGECRERAISLINIRPDNLLETPEGIVYVDIGECVRHWTEAYWRNMAERAYLSCRFWARPDLKSLMTRSITERLPELRGVGILRSDVAQHHAVGGAGHYPWTAQNVTLLIRTCFMEADLIGDQIRHLVRQLDTPKRLAERIVVCDTNPGPFARAWAPARERETLDALNELRKDGLVDRIVVNERCVEKIREVNHRWFGLASVSPVSAGAEPTFASLAGFDACRTDLILQLDSDCLIGRFDPESDYLAPMLNVLETDARGVSVALPPPLRYPQPFTSGEGNETWRVGVRCSLLSLPRIKGLLPLPNSLTVDGCLNLSWYRSLDLRLRQASGKSYRGGNPGTFVIHVPNRRKAQLAQVRAAAKAIEEGYLSTEQIGQVELVEVNPVGISEPVQVRQSNASQVARRRQRMLAER